MVDEALFRCPLPLQTPGVLQSEAALLDSWCFYRVSWPPLFRNWSTSSGVMSLQLVLLRVIAWLQTRRWRSERAARPGFEIHGRPIKSFDHRCNMAQGMLYFTYSNWIPRNNGRITLLQLWKHVVSVQSQICCSKQDTKRWEPIEYALKEWMPHLFIRELSEIHKLQYWGLLQTSGTAGEPRRPYTYRQHKPYLGSCEYIFNYWSKTFTMLTPTSPCRGWPEEWTGQWETK